MEHDADQGRGSTADERSVIEVHLTPEYARECLAMSLKRTRKRACKLLAELLQVARAPEPDLNRIRQLAEGIEFESKLAREISLAMPNRPV